MNAISLIVVQSTSLCNLNCSYCYLSEAERKQSKTFPLGFVYPTFLKIFTSKYVSEEQPIKILWHAGEPLLLSIQYYQEFIQQVQAALSTSGRSLTVIFDLQTNGQLLNPDWCKFFKANNIEVGVSCDGPEYLHDANRKTWDGRNTHQKAHRAMQLLHEFDINWIALATITPMTLNNAEAFFNFFWEQETPFLGLNFIRQVGQYTLNPLENYLQDAKRFLDQLFRLYLKHRFSTPESYMRIREFEFILKQLNPNCQDDKWALLNNPLYMITINADGDFSIYDPQLHTAFTTHYENHHFVVGNILKDELEDIVKSDKFQAIHSDVLQGTDLCRQSCDYFDLCNASYTASKQGEHGTFISTSTIQCTIATQLVAEVVLEHLQHQIEETKEQQAIADAFKINILNTPTDVLPDNKLIPGVRLYMDAGVETPEIMLSAGTEPEYEPVQDKMIYIPKPSWRPLSQQENKLLFAASNTSFCPTDSLAVCQLPSFLQERLQLIGLNKPALEDLVKDIRRWALNEYSSPSHYAECTTIGLTPDLPGMKTATRDFQFYLPQTPRVGLHVDYHEKSPPALSHLARNWLAFNLGTETRHFLFINIPIAKLFYYLDPKQKLQTLEQKPIQLARTFMANCSQYPVVKLALKPGQGYIAPTETIIHDASALEKTQPGYLLTFLGRFSLKSVSTLTNTNVQLTSPLHHS